MPVLVKHCWAAYSSSACVLTCYIDLGVLAAGDWSMQKSGWGATNVLPVGWDGIGMD